MTALRKIEVAAGIWWVEAPEAELYVLCGCPADSVKHLMKRGLIASTERNGVTFETGPNVILLSDVRLQNGRFSNLAEFPVLQMLYRQGMIIPKHPNNTGKKPLIVGLREQVDSQIQYIHRGNYGLVTEEEIVDTGVDSVLAHEMMRLKLRFAFGAIRHPRELLATSYLEDKAVDIGGGVMVSRLAVNVFEFSYKGEKVTVDINLPPNIEYEVPYQLGVHRIKREYFAIIHSGEGDGWDINRPSMGSILMFQGRVFLIDAGPNIEASLTALGIGVSEIEGIFHTHAHDDHFAGLTSLIRSDRRIRYFATPLVRASVSKKLSALMAIEEENFFDFFDVTDLTFDVWNDIDGLQVRPLLSPHPVENSIFIFRALWEGGWKSYAHFADLVSLDLLKSMITEDDEAPGVDKSFYTRIVSDYLTKVDVKKVDIGGGMIHGMASDFKTDKSRKIILSHLARRLTGEERTIGSGAPFGTVDVLIPSSQEYLWRFANEYLRAYFPTLPLHQLRVLLNNPLVEFNPETILIKEGDSNAYIYLILTGEVEMLGSESGVRSLLSTGSFIGEFIGLHDLPASETYRAITFLQTLRFPCDLYLEFIRQNNLFSSISRLQERREFLRRTRLCSEGMTDVVLNRIADAMTSKIFSPGEVVSVRDPVAVLVVNRGTVEHRLGDKLLETSEEGDFFGEEMALYSTPSVFSSIAATSVEVFIVPAVSIRDVPVVRWNLLESHERRVRDLISHGAGRSLIDWREDYSIGVQRLDNHHKRLFEAANRLFSAVETGKNLDEVIDVLEFLISYASFHFGEEEAILARYNYPQLESHRAEHRRLIEQASILRERVHGGEIEVGTELSRLVREWLIRHILDEDRRFATYLNEKGVY